MGSRTYGGTHFPVLFRKSVDCGQIWRGQDKGSGLWGGSWEANLPENSQPQVLTLHSIGNILECPQTFPSPWPVPPFTWCPL